MRQSALDMALMRVISMSDLTDPTIQRRQARCAMTSVDSAAKRSGEAEARKGGAAACSSRCGEIARRGSIPPQDQCYAAQTDGDLQCEEAAARHARRRSRYEYDELSACVAEGLPCPVQQSRKRPTFTFGIVV
jgi:hypothetical protein